MSSGIYKIENTTNGHFYIGSSGHIAKRRHQHRKDLRRNRHHSPILQRAWNKYGESAFIFTTLLICSKENLQFYEQRCVSAFEPHYNIMRCGDVGWIHTEETKRIQRARAKALWDDPEYLEKMRPRLERLAAIKEKNKAARAARASKPRMIEHAGVTLSYAGWAERMGISVGQVVHRIKKYGDDLTTALTPGARYDRPAQTFAAHGLTMTLREWSERLGVSVGTLYGRIHIQKMSLERAFTAGMLRKGRRFSSENVRAMSKKITFRGETLTYAEWAARIGISKSAMVSRVDTMGWDIERALTTPEVVGRPPKLLEYEGEMLSAVEIARRVGVSERSLRKRLAGGESLQEIAAGRKRNRYTFGQDTLTSDEWAARFSVSASAVLSAIKQHGETEGLRRLSERHARARLLRSFAADPRVSAHP